MDNYQNLTFDQERDIPKLRKLADEHNIWIGTSSWNYPGWVGKVYTGDYSGPRKSFVDARFREAQVREVTRVFPTVCFDGGYYGIPRDSVLERYGLDMPDNARMAIKVSDVVTQRRFNDGAHKGELNGDFLSTRVFEE